MADLCDDDRIELIEKYKLMLMESTNINDSEDELKVLDTILFRFWQMGWLDKLEQPTTQQWIPCSERYPDMDERVLVYTVAHDYFVWDCMSNRADNYFWEDEDGFYHDKYEVDMWMPLPEPWKGEKE